MYGGWSVEHAHTETFVAHCSFQVQCRNKVRDLDRSPKNMPITFFSQTLTVVQHTVFDVQASKRLFHPYNAVVLFNIIINYYYCCGRVWPCCCRLISVDTYATCHMHALSTLELRGGPEHARAIDSRSHPLSLSVCEN